MNLEPLSTIASSPEKPWHEKWKCQQCNKCCRYPTTVIFYRAEKEKFDRDFPQIKPKYIYHAPFDFFELDLKPGEYCPYFIDQKCIQHAQFGFDYKSKTCKKFPFYDLPPHTQEANPNEKGASTYCASIMRTTASAQFPQIKRNYTQFEQGVSEIWNTSQAAPNLKIILLKLNTLLAFTLVAHLPQQTVREQLKLWQESLTTPTQTLKNKKKPLVLRLLLAIIFRVDFNTSFWENFRLIAQFILNWGTINFRHESSPVNCRANLAPSEQLVQQPEAVASIIQAFVNQKLNYYQLQNKIQLLWLVLIIKASLWRVSNGDKNMETLKYALGLYDQAYLFRFQEYMQGRTTSIIDQLLNKPMAVEALIDF